MQYFLEYKACMHAVYQNLSALPGFVLLESSDKTRGRYDILSAYPYDRVQIYEHTIDKLQELKKLSEILCRGSSDLDLPFQGGAIGYISYDLGASLAGIHSIPQNNLKNMPLLDLSFYDWAIIVDHERSEVILYSDKQNAQTENIIPEIISLWNQNNEQKQEFILNNQFESLISEQEYKNSFQAIHDALYQGRSYQVNLTQPFQANYSGDPWGMYQKISSVNPVPFSAFYRSEFGDIISFSPERFLSFDQGEIFTSPIKGTIRRSDNSIEDDLYKKQLASCEKNRAENVMIVDLLRHDLGKIAKPGSIKVTNLCDIQSYAAVHHLVSDIQAESKGEILPFDVFLSCFPGGSITGAPKLESMRIINEQEPYARGIYCGSIGYFSNHGRFDTNIAIRTVTAKENILHLAAGGGIVIDSDWQDEYRECYTKITAIINGLK